MKPTENPLWHIAGIGALGSVVAGHFEQGSQAVRLILKNQQQLAAYQDNKLTIYSENKVLSAHPKAIAIHAINEPIRYLICCVKAYDVTPLLIQLEPYLDENSIIILIHNGLGVLDEIQTRLPQLRIICGICTIGAYLEKPYTVRAFLEGTFHLGAVVGQFTAKEMRTISVAFQQANLPLQWAENIENMMWEKFALNCSINMLTVIFACKNGALLAHLDLLKKLTAEIATVISAHGIEMSADELFQKLIQLLHRVGENYSSMYKDVHHHKPTEICYLNEFLIRQGRVMGVDTPVNDELIRQFYGVVTREVPEVF